MDEQDPENQSVNTGGGNRFLQKFGKNPLLLIAGILIVADLLLGGILVVSGRFNGEQAVRGN